MQVVDGDSAQNVEKWEAVEKHFPNEEGAPKTVRELNRYSLAWVGAANTSSETKTNFYKPKTSSFKYATRGDDFGN